MAVNKFLTQTRNDYAELLIAHGMTQKAKEVMDLDPYEPLFKAREVHPDTDPFIKDYNEMMLECYRDTFAIGFTLQQSACLYKNLMESVLFRLNKAKKDLLIQKEKQEDMNMICGNYSDFTTVETLKLEDLSGTFSVLDENVICAKVIGSKKIKYGIEQISGNGYEGNKYVYKDEKFVKDSLDTSVRSNISDNNDLTLYEYSRITASNNETEVFELVNIDNIEAKCIITLKGESDFNLVKISSSSKDTRLISLEISDDGIQFKNVMTTPIVLNDREAVYKNNNEIPNSGIRSFPSTKYVKITLQSDAITDDQIAFYKTTVNEKPIEEQKVPEEETSKPEENPLIPDKPGVTFPDDPSNLKPGYESGNVYDPDGNLIKPSDNHYGKDEIYQCHGHKRDEPCYCKPRDLFTYNQTTHELEYNQWK